MPSYKLYYFNGRGRAECCRLMFAAAGVEYEDVRLQKEEWVKHKPTTKFGQMPEIEIDGKKFGQSRAIMFYLAREFGFYPADNIEKLAVEEIVFLLEDMINVLVKAMFGKEEDKERLIKEFREGSLENTCANLEKVYKQNGDSGTVVGPKVTVADIAIFDVFSNLTKRFEGCLDKYPGLKKVLDKVGSIEGVKKWVETRPVTEF